MDRRAEIKRLKEEYRSLFDEFRMILALHDPMHIVGDQNPDEYDPEVSTILPRLRDAKLLGDCHRVIYEEFVEWFGAENAGDERAYDAIAQDIWNVWQRHSLARN